MFGQILGVFASVTANGGATHSQIEKMVWKGKKTDSIEIGEGTKFENLDDRVKEDKKLEGFVDDNSVSVGSTTNTKFDSASMDGSSRPFYGVELAGTMVHACGSFNLTTGAYASIFNAGFLSKGSFGVEGEDYLVLDSETIKNNKNLTSEDRTVLEPLTKEHVSVEEVEQEGECSVRGGLGFGTGVRLGVMSRDGFNPYVSVGASFVRTQMKLRMEEEEGGKKEYQSKSKFVPYFNVGVGANKIFSDGLLLGASYNWNFSKKSKFNFDNEEKGKGYYETYAVLKGDKITNSPDQSMNPLVKASYSTVMFSIGKVFKVS